MSLPASRLPDSIPVAGNTGRAQVIYELLSGLSGLALALFMWGHMFFVASILTGHQGFDWVAKGMEDYYIAQPTVIAITFLFLLHAVLAARKIPAKLEERRRMHEVARALRRRVSRVSVADQAYIPHIESELWIWQVRTGMVMLVLGSFHLILMCIDIFTPLFGVRTGIEAITSQARVAAGLWLVYAVLLVCVEFHASVGLYRLAVKWGIGARLSRRALRAIEHVLLAVFLALGSVTLLVLAGWLPPPLAFLLGP